MTMTNPSEHGPSRMNIFSRIQYWGRLLFKRDTPWKVRVILIAAIVYLLSPFDLVPDWIMGFGFLDDLAVISFLVAWAINLAEKTNK